MSASFSEATHEPRSTSASAVLTTTILHYGAVVGLFVVGVLTAILLVPLVLLVVTGCVLSQYIDTDSLWED